jgi:RimJ/RimL family protein N-acetyltransferase
MRGDGMDYKLKNGKTLHIREVKMEDTLDILAYMKKVNMETKNLMREPDEFTMTEEQEKEFLERVIASENEFMATAWIDDQLVCTAGIHGSGLKRVKHKVSLGISVLKQYHNLGIGLTVMQYLIHKAKEMNKTKIELDVRSDNPGAIHLYQKVGFQVEGKRERGFYVDNQYVDLILMGLKIEEEV